MFLMEENQRIGMADPRLYQESVKTRSRKPAG
jgi:hypothetical protein